jgi:DNA-binding NarL/FixJ family response regulator
MGQKLPNTRDPARLRILIADDHPLFRAALRQLLNGGSGFDVVGEAVDGVDALELCRRLLPDLVLMDVRMPRMDGLQATQAIKSEFPRTIVLVLTASMEPGSLSEALKAGAAGYILKDAHSSQIIESIRRVLRGESPLNQELAMQLLLQQMDEGSKEKEAKMVSMSSSYQDTTAVKRVAPSLDEILTPREIDVLRQVVQGQTNQQIAQNLFISLSSVKKHMQRILAKLGAKDRVQGAIRAIELGLLPEQDRE